jgi:ribosomal protein S18 acetylase RimI-like enzyme
VVAQAVAIRLCEERDLEFFDRFGSSLHLEFCRAEFARTPERLTILVAVDAEDHPVGKLHVDFEVREHEGAAVVVAAAVTPELQRRGIGTALMAEAETRACRRGRLAMVVGVEDANPGARRLYERLGYVPFATDNFVYEGSPRPNPGTWLRKELEC